MNVVIPTALRKHTGGAKSVEVSGGTVGEALQQLVFTYPELRDSLFDESSVLVSFVGVFVGGQNIRDLKGPDTELSTKDEILLVPAIAGG